MKKVFLVLGLLVFTSMVVFADEYVISTGTYTRSDGVTRYGFSGKGIYRDDPSAVNRKDEGPLPHGTYTMRNIGTTNLGPVTIELTPSSNNVMYGRRGFYIHGGTKSDGCIIINDPVFRKSLDGRTLTVR